MDYSLASVVTMLLGVVWASLIGLASAQSSIQSAVNLFVDFPAGLAFAENAVAAVIGSDRTATTYLIGCPTPTTLPSSVLEDYEYCDILITATQGPSTFVETATISLIPYLLAVVNIHCELDGITCANCVSFATFDYYEGLVQDTMTDTNRYAGASVATMFRSIPVVANTEQIYTRNSPLTEMSVTVGSTSTTQMLAVSALSALSAAPTSSSFAAITSTSHAGIPKITGQAGLAAGGLAAAVILGRL